MLNRKTDVNRPIPTLASNQNTNGLAFFGSFSGSIVRKNVRKKLAWTSSYTSWNP